MKLGHVDGESWLFLYCGTQSIFDFEALVCFICYILSAV